MRDFIKSRKNARRKDTATCAERRRILRGIAAGVPGVLLLGYLPRSAIARAAGHRALSFYHTHTDERCSVVYYEDGTYLADGLAEVNHLLRDFRSGEMHPIDRHLLDFLYAVQQKTDNRGRFHVISGYRSPKTNAMLREKSKGVAKKSLHMQGRAIDVRLPNVDTVLVRKAALSLQRGGVGFYQKSNFVHLDTGRVRYW